MEATPRSLLVIGTGLLGSSVGLAARRAGFGRRIGIDPSRQAATGAMRREAFDLLTEDYAAAGRVDVIVVACPVGKAGEVMAKLAKYTTERQLVTDTLSTKQSVIAAAEAAGLGDRFCAAHPMAGGDKGGPDAAREDLFDGATCYVFPRGEAGVAAVEFWSRLGCRVDATLAPDEHDKLMARVSHLPHVAAAALRLAAGDDCDRGGPGFRDTTRVAGGRPELWADILLDNAAEVGDAVDALAGKLGALRRAIESGDRVRLVQLLRDGGGID